MLGIRLRTSKNAYKGGSGSYVFVVYLKISNNVPKDVIDQPEETEEQNSLVRKEFFTSDMLLYVQEVLTHLIKLLPMSQDFLDVL